MFKYSFKAHTDTETKRIANFIETFEPKINFILDRSCFGMQITAEFISEDEKNSFLANLCSKLNLSEEGFYLK